MRDVNDFKERLLSNDDKSQENKANVRQLKTDNATFLECCVVLFGNVYSLRLHVH